MTEGAMDKALEVLEKGGLVVAPSDTVYGLLCDATNERVVEKLIKFKERPKGKAISVFVSDLEMLQEIVEVDGSQLKTLRELLPGPFTVVLKSKYKVSPLLEAEDGTLGIRIPKYKEITDLVKKFGKPITATSANLSGKSPYYNIKTLLKEIPQIKQKLIDFVIDKGTLPRNKPSTVVDLTKAEIKVLREGEITFTGKQSFTSVSPVETMRIAKKVISDQLSVISGKPLVLILDGELGVGKTIFVKGIGEYFGISDIISPTFVVYYEYDLKTFGLDKLVHCDLYNLKSEDEFEPLGLETYLKPGNVLAIEWGEKTRKIMDRLRSKGKVIYVKMRYKGKNRREIAISS